MSAAEVLRKPTEEEINSFRNNLLHWYDCHRRILPWRAPEGQTPVPYHVWLSEIMLQQTVVAAAIPYFLRFIEKWPTIHDLAQASQDEVMSEWAGLGYYARARNLHKAAQLVSGKLGGQFPRDQNALKGIPGIGDYTSAAIAAIAFNLPANVVDGNVERVMARYCVISEPLPGAKSLLRSAAGFFSEGRTDRPGDYAQALMDLGATVCTPRSPSCARCPVQITCRARKAGNPEDYPVTIKAKQKPERHGYIYWITNGRGDVLIERRPETGLLGGTFGFPTSEWVPQEQEPCHNLDIFNSGRYVPKVLKKTTVKHTFTHFSLSLRGFFVHLPQNAKLPGPNFQWIPEAKMEELRLPTLFRKFLTLMINN